LLEEKIFRSADAKIKKLFIIGNGCVENGCDPLIGLLKDCEKHQTNSFLFDPTKLTPMHALSCLAAEERLFFNILYSSYKRVTDGNTRYNSVKINGVPGSLKAMSIVAAAASFRMELAKRYQSGSSIKWRSSVHNVLNELGIYENGSAVVTTNWDNTLWKDSKLKNLCYLHGRCSNPMTMIFPTETIEEFTIQEILFSEIMDYLEKDSNTHNGIDDYSLLKKRFLIEGSKYEDLFSCENIMSHWLKSSEEIYFCGTALNIYDHELINTISREASKVSFNKVSIVNRTNGKGKIKEEDLKNKKDIVSGLLRYDSEKIEFIDAASF